MKKYLYLCLLLGTFLGYSNSIHAYGIDSLSNRNFGFKNAFGPIYSLNIVGSNLGVGYERFVDKDNMFAVKAGVLYGWHKYHNQYKEIAQSTTVQTGIKILPGTRGRVLQFATGLDVSYVSGKIYDVTLEKNIQRNAFAFVANADMIINTDNNVYFYLNTGCGLWFSSVDRKTDFLNINDNTLLNLQFSAGLRFRF